MAGRPRTIHQAKILKILRLLLRYQALVKTELLTLLELTVTQAHYKIIDTPVKDLAAQGIVLPLRRLKKSEYQALLQKRALDPPTYGDLLARIDPGKITPIPLENRTVRDRGGGSQVLVSLVDTIEGIQRIRTVYPDLEEDLRRTPWVVERVLQERFVLPPHLRGDVQRLLEISPSFFRFAIQFPHLAPKERAFLSHVWQNIPGLDDLDQKMFGMDSKITPADDLYHVATLFLYRDSLEGEDSATLVTGLKKEWNLIRKEKQEEEIREVLMSSLLTVRDLIDPGPITLATPSGRAYARALSSLLQKWRDPVIDNIRARISPQTRDLLDTERRDPIQDRLLQRDLAEEMNGILGDREFQGILKTYLLHASPWILDAVPPEPDNFSDPVTIGRNLLCRVYPNLDPPREERLIYLQEIDDLLRHYIRLDFEFYSASGKEDEEIFERREGVARQVRRLLSKWRDNSP